MLHYEPRNDQIEVSRSKGKVVQVAANAVWRASILGFQLRFQIDSNDFAGACQLFRKLQVPAATSIQEPSSRGRYLWMNSR